MRPATHIMQIPQNPYRGIRSHAATLEHDLTYEESRPLPTALWEEVQRVTTRMSPAGIAGNSSVREFIAHEYQNVAARCVALVPGAKYGLRIALEAIVNPGDHVLVPDPGYPLYSHLVQLVHGVPTPYPLTKENSFQIARENLVPLITRNTRAIVLNSPALPMGTTFSSRTLETIANIACDYDLAVISDEVLKTLSETPYVSIATLPDMEKRTFIVESVSKRFLLSEWRAGWLVFPASLVEAVGHILASGAPLAQNEQALLTVLLQHEYAKDPWVWDLRKQLQEKRQKTLSALSRIPFLSTRSPVAGNWLFPHIVGRKFDDVGLAQRLAEKEIGVFPGRIFGSHGKQHIAISCAKQEKVLEGNLEALEIACKNL